MQPVKTIVTPSVARSRRALRALAAVLPVALALFGGWGGIGPGVRATAAEAAPLPQEQEIFDLIRTTLTPKQQRTEVVLDPILCQVARARATDMGVRRFFGHVNPDGIGANRAVEAAGYPLPAGWADDPAANNIESIAAGYPTATEVWYGWMGSTTHRAHLLGEDPFFNAQTYFGVGFASVPGSPYIQYWVVITAPPARLVIDSPAPGAAVDAAGVAVKGRTTGEPAAATVMARVENGGGVGDWVVGSGGVEWTVAVTGLVRGENLLRVRSVAAAGQTIAEVERRVTAVQFAPLTVNIAGPGRVSDGFAGATMREVGRQYTVTAYPDAGALFAGWQGVVPSNERAVSFTMAQGLALTARFIPNPFLAIAGNYQGYVGSAHGSALITLTVTPMGRFTVAAEGAGWRGQQIGGFDFDRRATVAVGGVALHLTFDGAGALAVAADGGNGPAALARQAYSVRGNPCLVAGKYTLAFGGSSGLPAGGGFAVAEVGANGQMRLSGKLADGTTFGGGAYMDAAGAAVVDCGLYRGAGWLRGRLALADADGRRAVGTLEWSRPALATAPLYRDGFVGTLEVVAAPYNYARRPPLAWAKGRARFAGGGLPAPAEVPVVARWAVLFGMAANGGRVSLRLYESTGLVVGTADRLGGARPWAVNAVLLQGPDRVVGFFGGAPAAGAVTVEGGE